MSKYKRQMNSYGMPMPTQTVKISKVLRIFS